MENMGAVPVFWISEEPSNIYKTSQASVPGLWKEHLEDEN